MAEKQSILDKIDLDLHKKKGSGGYRPDLLEAIHEIIGDLRERLKDQREMQGLAKTQIESMQTENRRAYDKLDKFEAVTAQMQKELGLCYRKLRSLGVDPEALQLEDASAKKNGTDQDQDEPKGQ